MVLKKCGRILAAVLAAAMLPMQFAGVSAEESNTVKLTACADTYVEGGKAGQDTNYGSEEVLLAKRQMKNVLDNKNDRAAYIKFDLSELTELTANEIAGASVSLSNVDSADCSASVWATDWAQWEEDTLTASTVNLSDYSEMEAQYTLISDITAKANQTTDVDVSDYLSDLLKDGKNVFTIVITGETKSSMIARQQLKLASRETTLGAKYKPTLTISKKVAEPRTDYDAVEDGYVSEQEPDKCFGKAEEVLLGDGNIGIFKFDITEPKISTLKSAKVSFFVQKSGVTLPIKIYKTENDWSCDTVTYNSMPQKGELCTQTELTGGTRSEADVTRAVAEAIGNGETSISFIVESDNAGAIASTFSNSNRPRLQFEERNVIANPDQKNTFIRFSETAYVRPDDRDTNYGGSIALKTGMRQGLLKVNIESVADTDFNKAILSLFTSAAETPSAVTEIEAYAMDPSWSQDTVTYNNMQQRGNLIGRFTTQQGTWSRLDITDFVQTETAKGVSEISLLLIQIANPGRQMMISDTNAETNASVLNIYYPANEENKVTLANGNTGAWQMSQAKQSQEEFSLEEDGAYALSPDYTKIIENLGADNWSDYKFLLKARITADVNTTAELGLPQDSSANTRLFRIQSTEDAVRVYTNTTISGKNQPDTVFENDFKLTDQILCEAVIEGNRIDYYINGTAAGSTEFQDGLPATANRVGLYGFGGKVKFSGTELFGFSHYSGNRSFYAETESLSPIDSMESVKLDFTTEITKEAFADCISINGERVDSGRISVVEDGKTLSIAPPPEGFEAHSNYTLYIDAQNASDLWGENIAVPYLSMSFSVTGWDCSAVALQGTRGQDSAQAEVRIKNKTGQNRTVSILLVHAIGSESAYMFGEKAIKKVEVAAGDELRESITLTGLSDGGFMKLFVYDSDTYEPILRIPYTY